MHSDFITNLLRDRSPWSLRNCGAGRFESPWVGRGRIRAAGGFKPLTRISPQKTSDRATVESSDRNNQTVDLGQIPSTRYQGSKRKILPWIWQHLQPISFSSVLDVFGGSASVSYLLKKVGKEVTYNDNLKFNHQIGRALIENDDVTLSELDVQSALEPEPAPTRYFVRDTFKGMYFTDEENEWIDRLVARIVATTGEGREPDFKKAILYYALFQSCLIKRPYNLFHRRNLYFRFADVKRTFSNKRTWDTPFEKHFTAFCHRANKAVFKGLRKSRAICFDATEIPETNFDLVYIDPPYLSKHKYHDSTNYLRCYHFLEGLVQYDDWADLIDRKSINLRFKDTGSNPWIDFNKQAATFDCLLEKFSKSIIAVSYKKFGVPSIDTLIKMFKRHGRRVRSHSRHYIYALNHQNGEAKLNREVLLISE